jgi:hypothetical protein
VALKSDKKSEEMILRDDDFSSKPGLNDQNCRSDKGILEDGRWEGEEVRARRVRPDFHNCFIRVSSVPNRGGFTQTACIYCLCKEGRVP